MTVLAPREGYRRWAPTYGAETAITWLEDALAGELTPPLAGLRLLDAGCGTGRRMRASGAAVAVGADLSPEMLAASGPGGGLLAADVRALPFPGASFDAVWCRLAIGHLSDAAAVYAELARVCRPAGTVLVTDFHADAVAAGHRRTFRDADGVVREVEHHVHTAGQQIRAAAAAGLTLAGRRDGRVGPAIRPFYERAGRLAAYREQEGLAVVLALAFRREGVA
ncbi:MAG TPA: class I SAM-dependent methyltransferase [Longimicrobiaceae bacterium]|nr:class I SAM-dependent methyltransferase [Longimicrobiaceae bacterium]